MNPGIRSKNKRANQENWPIPSHHKNDPIAYPNIAPKIEPKEQINAKRKAFTLRPKAKGINKTSGGIGKNEASEKDNIDNDLNEFGFSDKPRTQLYNFRNTFNQFLEKTAILDITSL